MNTLFIIALFIQICFSNGFIIQHSFIKPNSKLYDNDKNYFGTEYDLELTPYEKNILDNELSHLFMEQRCHFPNKNSCISEIYTNHRKYNLLNRLIYNLDNERTIIVNKLKELGIDITKKQEEEDEDNFE